jgi:hypothetical protein
MPGSARFRDGAADAAVAIVPAPKCARVFQTRRPVMKPRRQRPAAAILLTAVLSLSLANPADAHKPPRWVHCKPPFRPRWISLPTGKPGWKCVAVIKPLR